MTIFFGDESTSYDPKQYRGSNVLIREPFASVGKELGLTQLIFAHQTHGTDGIVLKTTEQQKLSSFVHDSDYLLTNQPGIGLGISTADCLPIVMIDRRNKIVGNIHAGWRGACAGIVPTAIARAQQEFGSKLEDLEFFFGPSAGGCCYEVQQNFINEFSAYQFAHEALRIVGKKFYFDLPNFVSLQLQSRGVPSTHINRDNNKCTICSANYCSVRKQPGSPMRQMAVVAIKKHSQL